MGVMAMEEVPSNAPAASSALAVMVDKALDLGTSGLGG
jgi:hypothetical protein